MKGKIVADSLVLNPFFMIAFTYADLGAAYRFPYSFSLPLVTSSIPVGVNSRKWFGVHLTKKCISRP